MSWLIALLARDTSLWSDDVWIADSTPVECGPSRETARRSQLAGWAEYGVLRQPLALLLGLRLHLLTTLHGLPAGSALTGAKADERQVLLGILGEPPLRAGRAGQVIIADKNYYGREFETALASDGFCQVVSSPGRGTTVTDRIGLADQMAGNAGAVPLTTRMG